MTADAALLKANRSWLLAELAASIHRPDEPSPLAPLIDPDAEANAAQAEASRLEQEKAAHEAEAATVKEQTDVLPCQECGAYKSKPGNPIIICDR